jgi:hypothetical protein
MGAAYDRRPTAFSRITCFTTLYIFRAATPHFMLVNFKTLGCEHAFGVAPDIF